MMISEDEAHDLLTTVFGADWEMDLIAAGVVGGSEDDEILRDQVRVVDMAQEKGLDRETATMVGWAWFTLWSVDPSAPPGMR